MPIYDYACTVCGRVVEVVHGVSGQGPEACATCGGAMRKLLSSPAVHFKGSGWAKKDRRASSQTKAAARSGSSSDSSSSDSSSADRSSTDGPKTDSSSTDASNSDGSKASSASGISKSSPATSEASRAAASTAGADPA